MSINTFQVSIYGNLTPFKQNPLLSAGRVRIFYKGLNRNRTFITDEFAEKLIASLPYTPISGIWSDEDKDFTDHGESREEGRIYGLVPENPNVSWETHLDEDGVEREYCCCDVVLFTARYEHARNIIGKPQSMELYSKSLKGEWIVYEGKKCYRFSDGCFIGLQVLGDEVEPCFEGAAFYTYANSLKEMIDLIKNYTINGGKQMLNFKLSDREKFDAIWCLLNPDCNEEGNWTIDYNICDVYDEYALVFSCGEKKYYRCKYTKNDETNSIELGEMTEVFILDISDAELKALEVLRAANGGTFTEMDSKFQTLSEENATLKGKEETFTTTIEDLTQEKTVLTEAVSAGAATIESLNAKIGELKTNALSSQETIDGLNTELNGLKEFKAQIETEQKMNEIAKYAMLGEDIVAEFIEKVGEYTLEDLQNSLKIAYVNSNAQQIFSNQNQPKNHFIPQEPSGDSGVRTGAAGLINKHKHNGGKE